MADSLSLALLVLLESLSPEQRAVLLLRDVFDYGYPEIAEIVGKTEDNARQLATRARRHVEQGRPRFEASRRQRDELARRFFAAAQDGDLKALEALLAHDVVLRGDGGGKVPVLRRSLHGRSRVARTLAAWARQGAPDKLRHIGPSQILMRSCNGDTADPGPHSSRFVGRRQGGDWRLPLLWLLDGHGVRGRWELINRRAHRAVSLRRPSPAGSSHAGGGRAATTRRC